MFVHNINPTIFSLGPVDIRYYGLVYVIGFLLAYFLLRKYRTKVNLTINQIDDLLIYLILGVLIGSRIFEIIFWEPAYYFSNPIQMLYFWKGGMSFHGGLVGIALALWLYIKKNKKVKFMQLADLLALPAMLMLAIGRIANFVNGELPGKITNTNWCVKFPNYDGCRHPSQIYESIKNFIAFFILLLLNKKEWKDGFIFWNFVLLYGIGRFITDFWRDDPIILFGLNMGQLLSLAMVIVAVIFFVKNHKEDFKKF